MVLMKQTKQQPQKEKERGREKERQEVLWEEKWRALSS